MEKGETIIMTSANRTTWMNKTALTVLTCILEYIFFIKDPPLVLSLLFNDVPLRWDSSVIQPFQWMGILFVTIDFLRWLLAWPNSRSYMTVHENCVAGYTSTAAIYPQGPFELTYDKIVDVRNDEDRKRVVIQTELRAYEVREKEKALREGIVQEIRKRIAQDA